VAADDSGEARVCLSPALIGGDCFRLRAYVGPTTQDKDPTQAGDDVAETGTMVMWRTQRVCRQVGMTNSTAEGNLPGFLKPGGQLYSEKYTEELGDLPALDLQGAISQEFAKSHIQLLLEPAARTRENITVHEVSIRRKIAHLLQHYPKFNRSSEASARGGTMKLSIFRTRMTVADSARHTFTATLPARPALGTLTVRPILKEVDLQTRKVTEKGAGKDQAVLTDEGCQATDGGKAVGQTVFLFGGPQETIAKYNRLVVHEMSHSLYLQHAPGSPQASGVQPKLHDKEDVCVMSYDAGSDGDHCGKCVANLRGIKVGSLP